MSGVMWGGERWGVRGERGEASEGWEVGGGRWDARVEG